MEQDGSKLENLKKNLYSRGEEPEKGRRFKVKEKEFFVKENWDEPDSGRIAETGDRGKMSIWNKLLVFSGVFFIAALAVSSYIFLKGGNVVSSGNLEIIVSGPVSAAGGEELSFQISVLNKNSIALDSVNLTVEYPENTRMSSNLGAPLLRESEALGTLLPGERFQKVLKAALFGKEGEQKAIKITVEYRVSGSSAVFYKEKKYDLIISSSPVSLSVLSPEEANSGQEVVFEVKVASNSKAPVKNTILLADYPFGFKPTESQPKGTSDNVWYIGDLNPTDERKIKIKGKIEAENGESRTFHFSLGLRDEKDSSKISTVFSSTVRQISIKKPSISMNMSVNGKTGDVFVALGDGNLRVDLVWANNLPFQVRNLSAEAALSGNLVSKYKVTVPTGYYRTTDNTLFWSKDKNGLPESENPGGNGVISFNIRVPSVPDFIASGVKNPFLKIESVIKGAPDASGGSDASLAENRDSVVIKVSSVISLESSAANSGGGKFRVLLKLKNTLNDASDTKISASLPAYLKYEGNASPAEEDVSYNPVGGEILWLAGKVKAGTGYGEPSRQLSFDVSLEPGYDLGENPTILKDIKVSAEDDFTLALLTQSAPNLGI